MKISCTAAVFVFVPLLASAAQTPTASQAKQTHQSPDNLSVLVATAMAQNPELSSIEARIEALQHKVTVAGAWKDPKLVLSYLNVPVDSFELGQEPMSMARVQLEQTVPFFGKTHDRRAVVEQAVQNQRHQLEERRSQLRSLVKRVYYKLALARQLEVITDEHIDLVVQLIDAVRIKYEVGRAAQHDLLRLEVLRDRLKDDLDDFHRQEKQLTATLNATLHRDVTTPIGTPDAFEIPPASMSLSKLQELAIEHRPALKALLSTAAMHRAAERLARFEAVPDPTFFAAYGLRKEMPNGQGGRDFVTLGVGVPLPVFYGSRFEARAAQESSSAHATDMQRDALVDQIDSGLADALATWQRAHSKVKTYREHLVPDAHKTLDSTFASYQVDRADFVSLFDAELELLKFEKTIRIANVSGLVAIATVEMLTGEEL